MKKLLTYLLTFAMLITILIPAMKPALAVATIEGADILREAKTESKDVSANVTAPEIEDVFYVELGWGSMEFNIVDEGSRSYNPVTMEEEYSPNVTVTPAKDGANRFQIRNNSNFDVLASTTITDNTEGQLKGTFSGGGRSDVTESSLNMTKGSKNQIYTYTFNFEATEKFKMKQAENVKIATISIELKKYGM